MAEIQEQEDVLVTDYWVAAAAYSEMATLARRMAELYIRIGYLECANSCADEADRHEQSAAHNRAMCKTTADGYEALAKEIENA